MRASFPRAALAVGAVALLAAACSDGGGGRVGMATRVYTAPDAPDPFEGVDHVVLSVRGPDLKGEREEVFPFDGTSELELDRIPYVASGATRQMVIEGWAGDGMGNPDHRISHGRTVPAPVRADGEDARDRFVLMARRNSFLPLTSVGDRTAQALTDGRVGHTVTSTSTSRVLVAGGGLPSGPDAAWWGPEGYDRLTSAVERIDVPGRARRTLSSELHTPRLWHTATAIRTGHVFLAGGWNAGGSALGTVEMYRPDPGGGMAEAPLEAELAKERAGHTATLLRDEAPFPILFVGGDTDGTGTWELWSPQDSDGTLAQGELPDGAPRRFHAAARFEVEQREQPFVLIVGGETDEGPLSSAMVFDAASREMLPLDGAMPSGARTQLTATTVAERDAIYLVGGFTARDRSAATAAVDVFNTAGNPPAFRDDTGGFELHAARGGHTTVGMEGNTVLIAGGLTGSGMVRDGIEVIHEFRPPDGPPRISVAAPEDSCGEGEACPRVPRMPAPRYGAGGVLLPTGRALLVGGARKPEAGGVATVDGLTLYNPR